MAERLDDESISSQLEGSSWRREGNGIVRDWEFPDFASACAFANAVADLAEVANHHPDLLAHGWNRVRVTISSHSAGGITDSDFALADAIDELG